MYVITDLQVGGVPLHLLRLATAMQARGLAVRVVSLAPPGPVADRLEAAGIAVDSCDGRGGADVRVVLRLARLLRRHRPRLVHALLFHANLASRWAGRLAGIPPRRILCEIQTVEIERRWHLVVDRWTHRGCRWTIGNSPSVIEHLQREARIPPSRLRLVRGGVDVRRLQDAAPIDRALIGAVPSDRLVLWVGRLDPIKGVDALIESMRHIDTASHVRLLLVGDGPFRARIVEQIERLCLGRSVTLLGTREDVPSLLHTADVFAFPSRTEGLPNALLEAMAAGCAIVTTDAPGCRDLVRHEATGLVTPVGDASALGRAIQRLLSDDDLRRRLGAAAAEEAAAHWSFERMITAYLELYAEVGAFAFEGG